MSIEFNHIIVRVKDKWKSARFLANILGVEAGPEWAQFVLVRTNNGVSLDFLDSDNFQPLHCAFLVDDAEFDAALARIKDVGCKYYADFGGNGPSQINHLYGGRGVYFDDPNGHVYELITKPYGETPEQFREI